MVSLKYRQKSVVCFIPLGPCPHAQARAVHHGELTCLYLFLILKVLTFRPVRTHVSKKAASPKRKANSLWNETTALEKEVQEAGKLPYKSNGWRCNHCGDECWNRNQARMTFHLGGDMSLLDTSFGFAGCTVCKDVTDLVAEKANAEMCRQKSAKTRQRLARRLGEGAAYHRRKERLDGALSDA